MGHFERIRYPDGQVSAKFIKGEEAGVPSPIQERINSYEDLMYVRAIADIFPHNGMRLFIPCLFGQRSDRRFDSYQSFDLKLITDIINSCNYQSVEIFDPHSDVSMALINNSKKKSSIGFVAKAIEHIHSLQSMGDGHLTDLLLVSPDAGAYKKVFEYGAALNFPVIGAIKHRDKDGTIAMSFTDTVKNKTCLIVDDLCDGGATFISLAKLLKLKGAGKVYLYVSHGIFSKGFDALVNCIDHIYCTNSVKDMEPHVGLGTMKILENYITQYKVI